MQDYEIRDVIGRATTAEFEIHTVLTQHLIPNQVGLEYKIFVRIKNVGKITGYDVMAVIANAPAGSFNCEPLLWEFKRGSPGITLLSKFPIHPTMDQALADWRPGLGAITTQQLFTVNKFTNDISHITASYRGDPLAMTITMFAKDQPPAMAQIEYSKSEIESRMPRSFLCKPAV